MSGSSIELGIALVALLMATGLTGSSGLSAKREEAEPKELPPIRGLTGHVSDIRIALSAPDKVKPLAEAHPPADIDLKRMAEWALNYLVETPRKQLDYEPVFQCHPLRCPPIPVGEDPVVACDTDARMDWEWYYMRDITGSQRGKEVEAAFHKRIRNYIGPDGRVWSYPGCYNEGDINARYTEADRVIHIWGATKILKSLAEDYTRTHNAESKALAHKVMLALKKLATWDPQGRCWFPGGMGALKPDGTIVPNGWNSHPAPIVEPLITYWQATKDSEGLDFAKAYAEGIINNLQPGGIRFQPDGSFGGHSHATMHSIWGIAHLGLVTGERKYLDFAKRVWDWMLTRGTGTGWYPAGPDNCNETCCVSDMISIAVCLGRGGHPEYFDFAERYLRNYISNLQFLVTPEFEATYRAHNKTASEAQIEAGLKELRRFQGGIIGGSGLNDYENTLLGGASGFEMFGCCAPEGMRAIYTTWSHVIDHWPASALGPAGVYVNLNLNRESKWGRVVSFLPDTGRLTVKAAVKDAFFLRPPHWTPRAQVKAFVDAKPVPVTWSGDYVRFDAHPGQELTLTYPLVEYTQEVSGLWKSCAPDLHMTFHWVGNMVVSATPPATGTPLFTGKPRLLPPVSQ